jgi:hypothetical protein
MKCDCDWCARVLLVGLTRLRRISDSVLVKGCGGRV